MEQIIILSTNEVYDYWVDIAPFIEKALVYNENELDLGDVFHFLLMGTFKAIIIFEKEPMGSVSTNVIKAVSIFEMVDHPKKRICHIILLSSIDANKYRVSFLDELYKIARNANADSIYLHGRKGWKRFLERDGFNEIYTVLERKL